VLGVLGALDVLSILGMLVLLGVFSEVGVRLCLVWLVCWVHLEWLFCLI